MFLNAISCLGRILSTEHFSDIVIISRVCSYSKQLTVSSRLFQIGRERKEVARNPFQFSDYNHRVYSLVENNLLNGQGLQKVWLHISMIQPHNSSS
jgi:hypothetical protein